MPLFLLSFRQRDALARIAERIGWTPAATASPEAIERRFLASGATIALVDARDRTADALAVVRELAEAVEANRAAMVVLLPRRELATIAAAFDAGATHYLAGAFADGELGQALRYAARHAERLGGRDAGRRARPPAGELTWRWSPAAPHDVTPSPALAALAGLDGPGGAVPRGRLAARLGREGEIILSLRKQY